MTQIVAGQACYNCDDVARAKKAEQQGVDPSQIYSNGEVKPGLDKTITAKAVTPTQKPGENEPLSDGNRGTTLNLLA